MYYIIENYDIYRGHQCLIRAVPVDCISWAKLNQMGLTARPCKP